MLGPSFQKSPCARHKALDSSIPSIPSDLFVLETKWKVPWAPQEKKDERREQYQERTLNESPEWMKLIGIEGAKEEQSDEVNIKKQ